MGWRSKGLLNCGQFYEPTSQTALDTALDAPRLEGGLLGRDLAGDVGEVTGEEVLHALRVRDAVESLLRVHLVFFQYSVMPPQKRTTRDEESIVDLRMTRRQPWS